MKICAGNRQVLSSELLGRTFLPIMAVMENLSPLQRKEFAAVMAARVVEALALSSNLGFSQQLLVCLIVLPYVLLSGLLSLREYVITFSLSRNLCDTLFFFDRGVIFASGSHVAVARIEVYTDSGSTALLSSLVVQCVCVWAATASMVHCPVLYCVMLIFNYRAV